MLEINFKKGFGSDNHSGIHPHILKALFEVNKSHAPSYGTDSITELVRKKFCSLFGNNAQPFYVFNGTAANVLSIKTLIESWQSVLCSDISHLNIDECGAPEAIAGVKLIPVKSNSQGKLTPEELEKHMIRLGDQHFSQPGLLSITQPTELGTVYTLEELSELHEFAQKYQLKIHIDGARLANAAFYLKVTFKEILQVFPADAVSFGGTKNGLLGGEAVLLWNPDHIKKFKYVRKQNLQLPSKMRFLSIQFYTYLQDDLYLKIAEHSHMMAKLLEEKIKGLPHIHICYPVESNAVFIQFPKKWTTSLKENKFFYIWDSQHWIARLMTSFDTTESDINEFQSSLLQLSEKGVNNEI
ncbi:MAG: low specificity L-threonine aldolase [Bdellovibrionales bacterium]|nr:low specificity L-threonine aldolase [Bdellovibrionales bacterium]